MAAGLQRQFDELVAKSKESAVHLQRTVQTWQTKRAELERHGLLSAYADADKRASESGLNVISSGSWRA